MCSACIFFSFCNLKKKEKQILKQCHLLVARRAALEMKDVLTAA
jgi:hypothetical protein